MGRKFIYGTIAVILIAVGFFIIRYYYSDERRIKRIIEGGRKAVEAEDIKRCMSYVSIHYSDSHGLNYILVKRILEDVFREFDGFEVITRELRVTVNNDTATAGFKGAVIVNIEEIRGFLVGGNDGPIEIKVALNRERFGWKVVRVEGIKPPFE